MHIITATQEAEVGELQVPGQQLTEALNRDGDVAQW